MAKESAGDWYLREWMAERGKRQAALVNELGWTKNRAHIIWHGKQPYRRKDVNEISAWLGIEPFELLMPPQRATIFRAYRDSARQIAAEEAGVPFRAPRTGTRG